MASPFPELIGAACELVSFIIPYPRFSDLDRFGTSQRHSETQIGTIWNSTISMPEAAALSPSDLRSSSTVEVLQRTKKNWDVLGCNKQNMGRSLTKPRLALDFRKFMASNIPTSYSLHTVYMSFTCPLHGPCHQWITSRPPGLAFERDGLETGHRGLERHQESTAGVWHGRCGSLAARPRPCLWRIEHGMITPLSWETRETTDIWHCMTMAYYGCIIVYVYNIYIYIYTVLYVVTAGTASPSMTSSLVSPLPLVLP